MTTRVLEYAADFWPHVIVMVALGVGALRAPSSAVWIISILTLGAAIALTIINRLLATLAPPMHDTIGWVGWTATILTASIPLFAVVIAARIARRRSGSKVSAVVLVGASGLLAIVTYPLYGMLLYCGFTGICP